MINTNWTNLNLQFHCRCLTVFWNTCNSFKFHIFTSIRWNCHKCGVSWWGDVGHYVDKLISQQHLHYFPHVLHEVWGNCFCNFDEQKQKSLMYRLLSWCGTFTCSTIITSMESLDQSGFLQQQYSSENSINAQDLRQCPVLSNYMTNSLFNWHLARRFIECLYIHKYSIVN